MAEPNHSPSKVCSCCKVDKSRSEFFKSSCCKDGLRGECKRCVAEKQKVYNAKNADKIAAKKRETAQSEENKPRIAAQRAAHYAANSERIKRRVHEYNAKNAEKISARRKGMLWKARLTRAAWVEKNRERKKATARAWYAKNRKKLLPRLKASRARRRASGSINRHTVEALIRAQRGRCACCGVRAGNGAEYHLDHITPVSRGGTNARGNLQILCPACNLSKHAKDPIEFMQSRGFLL